MRRNDTGTLMTLRMPNGLRDELAKAADERVVSMTWLANRLIADGCLTTEEGGNADG